MSFFLTTNDRRTQAVVRDLPVGAGSTVILGGGVVVVEDQINVVVQDDQGTVVVPQDAEVVVSPSTPAIVTTPVTPGIVVVPSDSNGVRPIC